MLVLQIALDVVLMVFVLALLPLFLGDLLLFANPASGIGFILAAAAFFGVLWIIDHAADESFWLTLRDGRQFVAMAWKQHDWRLPVQSPKFRPG